MNKILIVDDEKTICNVLKFLFPNKMHYEVEVANNILEFNTMIKEFQPHIVLLDLNFGEVSGLDLLDTIKKIYPSTNVIMMTAYGTIETAILAMKKGALDYIAKPLNLKILKEMVDNTIRFSNIQERVLKVQKSMTQNKYMNMIGQSVEIQKVFDMIDKIKDKNVNVLIQGASGTGKELIAKNIHYHSTRKEKPFIAINCGAIPHELIESELFGYEKGAFTGADSSKKGKFELANGGTLFLDEIGELSLQNQVKLLRVLQDRVVQPLGNGKPVNIDVRIIAATNRNLSNEVKKGKFRGDLFFRLNVVFFDVPTLNERKEDIVLLVHNFIAEANEKYSTAIEGITKEALHILINHHYEGNIRELENIIYSTVLLCSGTVITEDNLLIYDIKGKKIDCENYGTIPVPLGSTMEEVEEIVIKNTIKLMNGNKTKAAKALGISERSLHYKVKSYGEEET